MSNKDVPALLAISGKSGCGNTTVGHLVAQHLGFNFINYTFRQMAAERGCSLAELAQLAQEDPSIDRQIDQYQIQLAGAGPAVVSSRLAIWLLPQAPLRVYLYASIQMRSMRIQKREGGSLNERKQQTYLRDQHDSQRYRQLYQIDNEDPSAATIILNTEQLDAQSCADIIIASWRIVSKK